MQRLQGVYHPFSLINREKIRSNYQKYKVGLIQSSQEYIVETFTGVNYGSGESSSATVPANIPPALGINYIAALEVNLDTGGYTFDQTSTNALSAQFRM